MRVLSFIIGSFLLVGCTTASSTLTGGPKSAGSKRHIIQYYLPETVLHLSLGGTDSAVLADAQQDVKVPYTISIRQIADKTYPIQFDVRRNFFSTTKFGLNVTSEGLLKQATASSQGALSTALSKLGSSAAKTNDIRAANSEEDVTKRLAAIQELTATNASQASVNLSESPNSGLKNRNGKIVMSAADFYQGFLGANVRPSMQCNFSQIADGNCAVSFISPLASEKATSILLEAPDAKTPLKARCPKVYFHEVEMAEGKPLPACVAKIGMRVSLVNQQNTNELRGLFDISGPTQTSAEGCPLGARQQDCKGYIFHRRFKPVALKVERCVQPLNADLTDCHWNEASVFEGQFAVRSQTYAVQYRSAALGSNAFAVNATDGRLEALRTHEINAASEIVAAPFVVINSILAVPRAILKNEGTLTTGGAVAAD